MAVTIDSVLDDLFANAGDIIDSLGNEFTSQEFLYRVINDRQGAYIDLLTLFRDAGQPFQQAHAALIARLSAVADERGYNADNQGRTTTDILGNPMSRILYRYLAC